MVLSKALRAATRGVSTSAGARMALPALTAAVPKPSMMSAIFGGSAGPAMPPMDQPVPGLAIPDPPAAPAAAPVTNITTLSNGAKIASEDTPVRLPPPRPVDPTTRGAPQSRTHANPTCKTPGPRGAGASRGGLTRRRASPNASRRGRGSPTRASTASDPKSSPDRARSAPIPSVTHPFARPHARRQNHERDQISKNRPHPLTLTHLSVPNQPPEPTTQGASIAVGMYVSSGSKWENPHVSGASHLLERMAWRATANRTAFRVTREAEVIGANLLASASREQMAYTVDCLRTNLPEAVELLTDAVMNQKLTDHEVANAAAALKKEMTELAENPAHLIMEAAHSVAFTGGLGAPLVATPAALTRLDGDALAHFVQATYTAPRVVLAAAGVDHAELVSVAEPLLSTLAPGPGVGAAPTTYVGGDYRVSTDSPLTNIILAFEFKGGWRDQKASTAMTVLNTLMGGGGSFSAGGPGKGMYSRLYNRVLNRHAWAQNCTSFHSVFDDTGVIGISGVADGPHAGDMVAVMARELAAVANGKIEAKELDRAKAATVSSILMNLESRAVVAEDIGRQILTYGERKSPAEFIAAINALTAAEISAVAAEALKSNPTLCMVGDLTAAPRFEQVKTLF